ncbi:MAG: Lrp/AsnC family transcriptional regulator [Armatimonadota bacterium]
MKEILDILDRDGRAPIEEIADRLGKTMEEVAAAIDSLERDGVILGYKALVDWDKTGEDKLYAFIEAKATPRPRRGFDEVAEHVSRFPQVHSVYLMSGAYDLTVVVQGRDFREIARFVAEELAPHPDISSTSTHFVLKTYKRDGHLLFGDRRNKRLPVTP